MYNASTTTLIGQENTKPMTCTSHMKRARVNNTAGRLEPWAKSTVRKPKTGRLSQLMSMPMDVLMEIFGHLHPLDLLHLTRTTKAFRRVLMHRSSIFVWKAALSTVPGLPACPPDLSEPQWANLAFDTHCSSCSRPNIRNVDWTLRVRLCARCTKLQLINWFDNCLKKEFDCSMADAVPMRLGKRSKLEFLRDEYDKVTARYHAIEDPDARETFLAERKELVKRIDEHANLCVAWTNAQALVRSDKLDHLRSSRHQAIVDKLVALGWGDEIEKIPGCDALTTHKLVKVPQLLTDRTWAKISGTMIEYMEKMKVNRLARELAALRPQRKLDAINLLRAYKVQRAPFTNVMPEPLDFFAFRPVKEIIEQPPDINVRPESFLHLMPELDGVVEQWRHMILKKFINEVKADVVSGSIFLTDNPLDIDAPAHSVLQRIQLACTVFTCVPCGDFRGYDVRFARPDRYNSTHPTTSQCLQMMLLWYPRVLGHRCLMKPLTRIITSDPMRLFGLPCRRQPWSCSSVIQVDQNACEAAAVIIWACEMDPSTATVDEMDRLDPKVECLACLVTDVENPSHIVFGWRSAVKHQRERHPSDLGDWRMLTASEAEMARLEESRWETITPKLMAPSDLKAWMCLHCLDSPAEQPWATLEAVRDHLGLIHGAEDPQVNRDYVKDFAAPELYATSTLFKAAVVKFPS